MEKFHNIVQNALRYEGDERIVFVERYLNMLYRNKCLENRVNMLESRIKSM